jgi:hypothetical protein
MAWLTEDPIGAGLSGPADRSAEGTVDRVIGGIPAGPGDPGEAAAAAVSGLYRRVAHWTASQSLSPTSISGVCLVLGICAAGWFTAGTRSGNINGAVALGVGYLAALSARELASQASHRLARASAELDGASAQQARGRSQRAVAARRLENLVRSGWLAVLSLRLTDCAVYAGLAVGAAAQGWPGMWPLAITVLSLVAIRDTMTACSAPAPAGRPHPGRPHPDQDDPDQDHLDSADSDPARDNPVVRAVVTVLAMPFGGRMLLIAVAAPLWGARASLLGLLDWGIIAVGYGIGSRTSARRRTRKAARRPSRPRAGPGALTVLLQPARPPEWGELRAGGPAGQSIPVLRMKLSPPPPGETLSAEPEAGSTGFDDAGVADAGFADAGFASRRPGVGGLRDIGFAGAEFAGSEFAGTEFAGSEFAGTEFADAQFDEPGFADTEFTGGGLAGAGHATGGPAGAAGTADAGQPAAHPPNEASSGGLSEVLRCRDDGAIARWFGRLVRGQLMPLPAALLALAAVAMLAHLGLRDLPGILILAPAIVMLVAAPGSSHPHSGRFDWLVPAVLQGAQYIYIAALGVATGVPVVLTFVLCAAIALHYADLGAVGSPERGVWMGWEGRMIICGLGAAMGIAMFVYVVLAAYVGGLICWKVMTSSLGNREGDRR